MDINNVNNSITGTTYQYSNYCPYRLPCGYCEKLGRDCPKQGYNGDLSLTGVTYTINPVDHSTIGVIK